MKVSIALIVLVALDLSKGQGKWSFKDKPKSSVENSADRSRGDGKQPRENADSQSLQRLKAWKEQQFNRLKALRQGQEPRQNPILTPDGRFKETVGPEPRPNVLPRPATFLTPDGRIKANVGREPRPKMLYRYIPPKFLYPGQRPNVLRRHRSHPILTPDGRIKANVGQEPRPKVLVRHIPATFLYPDGRVGRPRVNFMRPYSPLSILTPDGRIKETVGQEPRPDLGNAADRSRGGWRQPRKNANSRGFQRLKAWKQQQLNRLKSLRQGQEPRPDLGNGADRSREGWRQFMERANSRGLKRLKAWKKQQLNRLKPLRHLFTLPRSTVRKEKRKSKSRRKLPQSRTRSVLALGRPLSS